MVKPQEYSPYYNIPWQKYFRESLQYFYVKSIVHMKKWQEYYKSLSISVYLYRLYKKSTGIL